MKKCNIEFVRAADEDVYDLIKIQDMAFLKDYTKYGFCPGYGHTYESMSNIIYNCIVFKIMVNSSIVGDIIVSKKHEGNNFLGCLCVIPEYQNIGIGQTAINFLENYFKDATRWTLDTPADKQQNLYFYKKCGYKIIDEYFDKSVKVARLEKMK